MSDFKIDQLVVMKNNPGAVIFQVTEPPSPSGSLESGKVLCKYWQGNEDKNGRIIFDASELTEYKGS